MASNPMSTPRTVSEAVAGMDCVAVVPILVPIAVVGAGIVVERVLTRRYRQI